MPAFAGTAAKPYRHGTCRRSCTGTAGAHIETAVTAATTDGLRNHTRRVIASRLHVAGNPGMDVACGIAIATSATQAGLDTVRKLLRQTARKGTAARRPALGARGRACGRSP